MTEHIELSGELEQRRKKLDQLIDSGKTPYKYSYDKTHNISCILEKHEKYRYKMHRLR